MLPNVFSQATIVKLSQMAELTELPAPCETGLGVPSLAAPEKGLGVTPHLCGQTDTCENINF